MLSMDHYSPQTFSVSFNQPAAIESSALVLQQKRGTRPDVIERQSCDTCQSLARPARPAAYSAIQCPSFIERHVERVLSSAHTS